MSETAVDEKQAALDETVDDEIPEVVEAEEDSKEKSATREYIVFQEGNSGNWAEFGKSTAGNADAAIKAMNPKEGVRYAAVPVRNWSVAKAKIKIETTTTLEFE